jgi:hypothetical protein
MDTDGEDANACDDAAGDDYRDHRTVIAAAPIQATYVPVETSSPERALEGCRKGISDQSKLRLFSRPSAPPIQESQQKGRQKPLLAQHFLVFNLIRWFAWGCYGPPNRKLTPALIS